MRKSGRLGLKPYIIIQMIMMMIGHMVVEEVAMEIIIVQQKTLITRMNLLV